MSKEIVWGIIHGEGDIVCTCDNCKSEEWFQFEDGCFDFAEVSKTLKEDYGWLSRKIDWVWRDFCCDNCHKEFLEKRKNIR